MELKQNGNDIPDTKLFVETFGTISCAFCLLLLVFLLLSLKNCLCVILCRYEDRMWSQSISVWKRSLHPVRVAVWRRWGLQRRQRRELMWWGKNTLLSHSHANNLKCEGLRLMHVARFVQLRITEVNGFPDYNRLLQSEFKHSGHQTFAYVRKCNLPLPHTNSHLCCSDEDLLNIANARFWKLAKV